MFAGLPSFAAAPSAMNAITRITGVYNFAFAVTWYAWYRQRFKIDGGTTMIFGPMTMIVAVALVACLCAGLALLIRAKSDRSKLECGKCRHRNPQGAAFCAACGGKLTE